MSAAPRHLRARFLWSFLFREKKKGQHPGPGRLRLIQRKGALRTLGKQHGTAIRCERDKKLSLAVEWILDYGYIEKDIRLIEKNLVIMEYFLEITEPEKEIIIEIMEERRDSNMIVQELKRRGYREGMEHGIQQGVQQGKEQGKLEARRETAQALLNENMSAEKISKITGLDVGEIESLKRGERGS